MTDKYLSTPEASSYLLEMHGVVLAPSTLETKRSRGDGPNFEKVLRRAVYRPSSLDEYASKVTSGPLARTVTKSRTGVAGRNGKAA